MNTLKTILSTAAAKVSVYYATHPVAYDITLGFLAGFVLAKLL